MKKYLYSIVLAVLLLSVPVVPFVTGHVAEAASSMKTTAASSGRAPTPTPTPMKVEYALPYPGILPDNPLYVFKTLRDRIVEFLISDPVNKTEFYVLQADKKLNMGRTLSAAGKPEEAKEILNQSLDARKNAVHTLESAMKSGKKIPGYISEKIVLSLRKHEEVAAELHQPTDALQGLLTSAQHMLEQTR